MRKCKCCYCSNQCYDELTHDNDVQIIQFFTPPNLEDLWSGDQISIETTIAACGASSLLLAVLVI